MSRKSDFAVDFNAGQWVWVVGGGILQLPLIREIRRRGFKVLVSDGNPDCVGSCLADAFLNVSTYDVETHGIIAERWPLNTPSVIRGGKPIAVLTAGADVGPTVSMVAEVLGLRAAPLDVAMRCRNKGYMRQAVGSPPVSLTFEPEYRNPGEVWERKCAEEGVLPYPVVVKPLEECGSRGISVAGNEFDLRRALKVAKAADRQGHILCLVEKYHAPDLEIALDFFVEEGVPILVNSAKRDFDPAQFGMERGHYNPWTRSDKLIGEVTKLAHGVVGKLGVTDGPFKMDVIRDIKDQWVVIECATRLSGGFDHMTTALLATGRNVTAAMLDWALGHPCYLDWVNVDAGGWAYCYAPALMPGRVKRWDIEEARSSRGVRDIIITRPNDIPPPESCAARPLFIITTAVMPHQAYDLAMEAARKIKVVYE